MTSNRFQTVASQLLSTHNVKVVKILKGTYGRAYVGGREIAAPAPTGYMSFAIFCHEVGHVVLGHCDKTQRRKYRCLEEYEAWMFVVDTFKNSNIVLKQKVKDRMTRSLQRAVRKAINGGMKPENLPYEVRKYYQPGLHVRGGDYHGER